MDRILHDDFVLVLGDGTVHTKADLVHSARTRHATFEQQDEDPGTRVVRLYGDTAMVSARPLVEGLRRRQGLRLSSLVQRHLYPHLARLALCLCSGGHADPFISPQSRRLRHPTAMGDNRAQRYLWRGS